MISKKELLIGVLTDTLIEWLNKKYKIEYFSALQLVLASKTYEDLYKWEWFRQEGPVYIQSCFEKEIEENASLKHELEYNSLTSPHNPHPPTQ